MKKISYAWTSAALLAGAKTCTRRDWKTSYALSFREGELVQAWDKDTRVKGAQRISIVQLTHKPYLEHISAMPDSDYAAEGFEWYSQHPEMLPPTHGPMGVSWEAFVDWRKDDRVYWVVRSVLYPLLLPCPWRKGGLARSWHDGPCVTKKDRQPPFRDPVGLPAGDRSTTHPVHVAVAV